MKKIAFILSMAFYLNANCQDLVKKIQTETWFMTGNLLNPTGAVVLSTQKTPISDTEVKFSKDGKAHFITNGDKTTEVLCAYELKTDRIKIQSSSKSEAKKPTAIHYYKIKETTVSTNFEFVSITAADFK